MDITTSGRDCMYNQHKAWVCLVDHNNFDDLGTSKRGQSAPIFDAILIPSSAFEANPGRYFWRKYENVQQAGEGRAMIQSGWYIYMNIYPTPISHHIHTFSDFSQDRGGTLLLLT
jgi:hypothetical protein